MSTLKIHAGIHLFLRELCRGNSLRLPVMRTSVAFLILFQFASATLSAEERSVAPGGTVEAGVGMVDITPTEAVILAGSPNPKKSLEVQTRLYVQALVLAAQGKRIAIVTLDTLKYPVERVQEARAKIEQTTGIPACNVIICASHTHRGPLWTYYPDMLVTPISDAVAKAARDLTPCTLGAATGKAEGIAECRRVIKDGHAWNRWQLPPEEAGLHPAEGPSDPEFDLLALTGADGKLKAVLYNFACHAANTRAPVISADFPGDTKLYVQKELGYPVPTLFLTGACGDVNPVPNFRTNHFGDTVGSEIVRCLKNLEPISNPSLALECREFQMPGREHPEYKEAEIARNWPAQVEHYRKAYEEMKKREKPSYLYLITGIRISDDFAIITDADEIFCAIGLDIKKHSPFKHTIVAEQTNGAHGYVPTAKGFAGGSYETWFGEHSYLTTKAWEIIERESAEILTRLKKAP